MVFGKDLTPTKERRLFQLSISRGRTDRYLDIILSDFGRMVPFDRMSNFPPFIPRQLRQWVQRQPGAPRVGQGMCDVG